MRADRLLKLAEHLETGKLGHKIFSYNYLNMTVGGEEYDSRGCGTVGCALGECPIVFPKDWIFDPSYNDPLLIDAPSSSTSYRSAARFFDIENSDAHFLFHPSYNELPDGATKDEVAAHIRKFVEDRQKLEATNAS